MLISYPAPALCQGSDENLLMTIGDVVYPGFVGRPPTENGLRLWVKGDADDPDAKALARAMFQTLLGALRAFERKLASFARSNLLGLVRDRFETRLGTSGSG